MLGIEPIQFEELLYIDVDLLKETIKGAFSINNSYER